MIYAICNPTAGNGRGRKIGEQVKRALDEKGTASRLVMTQNPGHATALAQAARDAGADTVLSIGGDGTALEVARGLLGGSSALGIIPAGTGNDLIKTLGIPKDPEAALDHLLAHAPRPMDVGTINGRPFLNVCGTGFDVSVLDHTEKFKRHMRGLLPYFLGLLGAIFGNRPVRVGISVDGKPEEEEEILICAVANGRYIGGGIPICPAAEPGDGCFDLVKVKAVPRWRIPFYLPGLMGSKILTFRVTTHALVRSVTLRSPGMRIQIDGEIVPMDEARLELRPGALRVRY